MRYIRYLFLLVLAVCLITMAIANREVVTLTLLPEEVAVFAGVNYSTELPLFMVGLMGVAAGLLLGFLWEWLREAKFRSEASKRRREVNKLKREVGRLKKDKHRDEGRDEILALLEDGGKAG
ncbi:putative membrane protein [Rhodovulum iodosum]|uniref:Membrane protein n=1 Tax=Rhodovulum iodosum TaxID=68291 RepID=A0ABV3XWT5_9RHOB|nr:LapA family protein [Rhodovulum robiginosum]RSK34129.1 LapA family protein [Rhodovulum robiginosum]